MAGQHGGIPDAITRAKESTGKFVVKFIDKNFWAGKSGSQRNSKR